MLHKVALDRGPGSIALPRSRSPIVKANELLFVHFERPDLRAGRAISSRLRPDRRREKRKRTLHARDGNAALHLSRQPWTRRQARLGFGFSVPRMTDLERLSKAFGRPIETSDAPGGGSRRAPAAIRRAWRWTCCMASRGASLCRPRAPIPHNAPNQTVRVNDTQRPALEPPQVTKLGHLVLETPDFDTSARWYMDTLGFIPSDVMCLPNGDPVGSFMRLDRGDEPTDHHTLFVATGMESKADHVAFEVVDLDAVEMGQQVMLANRYRHAWGVGRHLLGSQIFDYWRDPWGQKHEHYADGDLFDSVAGTRLSPFGPCGPLSVGSRPAGRLHRRETDASPAVDDPAARREGPAAAETDAGSQERSHESGPPLAAIANTRAGHANAAGRSGDCPRTRDGRAGVALRDCRNGGRRTAPRLLRRPSHRPAGRIRDRAGAEQDEDHADNSRHR